MSHFDRSLQSQFFLTAPRPCPYLPGRSERKLFTHLVGPQAPTLNDELSNLGFRRSQTIVYRPACVGCGACVSTRIRVRDFAPTASQRRVVKRNADLRRRLARDAATDAQYALFCRYLAARHSDGGMTDMNADDFAAMIEDTPVRTQVIEYWSGASGIGEDVHGPRDENSNGPELLAACLTDRLSDGLSLVYSFFDPDSARRSLGRFMILDHIELAASLGLPFVYLGFWVQGSRKMDYKIQFQPAEIMSEHGWVAYKRD